MKRLGHFADYLFKKRWPIHVAFWTTVLLFYAVIFGRQNNNYIQTLFFIGLLMPVTIGTTYFLNNFLVPRFLLKERYGYFFLYFLYVIIGSLLLEMIVAFLTFIVMAGLQIKNMSPASVDLVFLLMALLMVIFLAVAIKLLMHWRQSRDDYQKLMLEKTAAELKFLKTQLNPHFLFNTLNNLYYLTTEKSDQAPKAILALSEILDYVLNASKQLVVPLAQELKQADNYIDLEMLRYHDRVTIEKSITADLDHQTICPMVLITLLENSFKHGVMSSSEQSWIRLKIVASAEAIKIEIANSVGSIRQKTKGIGLENLKSQLKHLYGDAYQLRVTVDTEKEFNLSLTLPKSWEPNA
jgi:sensor histidine kinase YesM